MNQSMMTIYKDLSPTSFLEHIYYLKGPPTSLEGKLSFRWWHRSLRYIWSAIERAIYQDTASTWIKLIDITVLETCVHCFWHYLTTSGLPKSNFAYCFQLFVYKCYLPIQIFIEPQHVLSTAEVLVNKSSHVNCERSC